jgi:hypothetical protein
MKGEEKVAQAGLKKLVVAAKEDGVAIVRADDDKAGGVLERDDIVVMVEAGMVDDEEGELADDDGDVDTAVVVFSAPSSSSESPSFGTRLRVAPPRRLRLRMRAILLLSGCAVGGSSSVLSMMEIHHLACATKKRSISAL